MFFLRIGFGIRFNSGLIGSVFQDRVLVFSKGSAFLDRITGSVQDLVFLDRIRWFLRTGSGGSEDRIRWFRGQDRMAFRG